MISKEEKVTFGSWSWNLSNLQEKWKYILQNVTVEPMLGCYIIASILAGFATQNLNLQKACRVNLKFSDEICTALDKQETGNYTAEEIQVQQLVSGMIIWKTMIQSSVPAVLIIFVGAWSDRSGRRKPGMLLPIVGEFLTSMGLILCTYFFYQLPMEIAGLVEAIFPAFTGGWMTMFMSVFSYTGDITTHKTRTLRIGVVSVFCSVGIPIGTALSGVLYKKLGSYGVYTISSALYFFSFLYGFFGIPESRLKDQESIEKQTTQTLSAKDKSSFLATFFSLNHIKEALAVAFKDDGNQRRIRIALLMVVVIVLMGPMHGEMNVMYMFTRVRFNWNEVDYSIYSTYMTVSNLLGTLFAVGVFSRVLEIDDALIGVLSCMSKILASFVYAFATTKFVFYLAPLVDIINGTSFIAMRSIISKLVPTDELGKVNSIVGACEAVVPSIYGPMYSYIYRRTLDKMPGAFFLVGGALTFPAVIIFWWLYTINKRKKKEGLASAIQISTIGGALKPVKDGLDFVCQNNNDADLKIILERRTYSCNNFTQCNDTENTSLEKKQVENNKSPVKEGVENESFEKEQ